MSYYYMPLNSPTAVISQKAVMPEPELKYRDRTKEFLQMMVRPIPEHQNKGGIQYRGIGIEGLMGRGKSTALKIIFRHVCDHYGRDQVNIIYKKCTSKADHIDNFGIENNFNLKPIQVVVLDDALFLSSSNQKDEDFKSWISDIRHKWERAVKQQFNTELLIGHIILVLVYQQRYDMNSRVRDYLSIKINMNPGNEKYYKADAANIFGDAAIKDMSIANAKIEMGDYSLIGKGLINADFLDGESAGWVYFKLRKDDKEKFLDMVDVNLDKLEYQLASKDKKALQVVVKEEMARSDAESFTDLDKIIVQEMLAQPKILDQFLHGIYSEEGVNLWKNNKPFKTDIEYQLQERVKAWVNSNFLMMEDKKITEQVIADRLKFKQENRTKLKTKIETRSFYDYYSMLTEFLRMKQCNKFVGAVIEKFVLLKLLSAKQYLEEHLLDQEQDLQEMILWFKESTFQLLADNCDLVFKNDKRLFMAINVKYVGTHTGKFFPTPEDKVAKENNCLLGVLVVENYNQPRILLDIYSPAKIFVGEKVSVPNTTFANWLEMLKRIYYFVSNHEKKKEEII